MNRARTGAGRRTEDGVAVVMVMGLVALLLLVALISGGLVALVATHRRVQAAADLAALAGATAARAGADPCAAAAEIAAANRTELDDCAVSGQVVDVVLGAEVFLGAGSWSLAGRARAGPVEAGG